MHFTIFWCTFIVCCLRYHRSLYYQNGTWTNQSLNISDEPFAGNTWPSKGKYSFLILGLTVLRDIYTSDKRNIKYTFCNYVIGERLKQKTQEQFKSFFRVL